MSQVGRIGGQVLTDNLLRAGVDLAFETDLLYLDVNNRKISIRDATPVYDLDVNSNIHTVDLTVDNQLQVGNIKITSPNTFSTTVGGISVYINGGGEIWHDRLTTANLVIDGNKISSISNSNIILDPNGSGTVEFLANSSIDGNLSVTGNIRMSGDLKGLGTLTIGDTVYDTVTVNTDFTQTIELADNELYTLGTPTKRWEKVFQSDWTSIGSAGTGLNTQNLYISDQIRVDGTSATVRAIQSNDDIQFNPNSGTTILERLAFNQNEITNLENTPLLFESTGTGFYTFTNNNAFVVPSGTTDERPATAELAQTRWNTDLGILECFDGNVWVVSTGGGIEVTQELMYDIGNIWTLVLG